MAEASELVAVEVTKRSQRRLFWPRLRQNKLALVGLAILFVFIIVAIAAPLVAQHNPNQVDLSKMLAKPSGDFLLGNDEVGRDILSRIIYGARVSLSIGLVVIAIGVGVGVPVGLASAYYGGTFDFWVQRLVDFMLAFPGLLLALMFVAVSGVGLQNVMIAVGLSVIPGYVRLERGSALAVKEEQYVQAARAIGSNDFRIMFRHVLPNCLSPIIVQSTLHMGIAILVAATLGFLGLGCPLLLRSGELWLTTASRSCESPPMYLAFLDWLSSWLCLVSTCWVTVSETL